jgi:hypothetical protein
MKRILLIANKNWEVEPILNALLNSRMRPPQLGNPNTLHYPWTFAAGTIQPRAVWSLAGALIELWCVQDIMQAKWNSSSSEGKNTDLPGVIGFRSEPPDLVIALGTAGFGSPVDNNIGCVVAGSNIFIHNFRPGGENADSKWDDPVHFEKLLTSSVDPSFFQLLDAPTIKLIESRLLKPFLNPSPVIQVLSDQNYLGLSTVNITVYKDYDTSDQIGIDQITKAGIALKVGSVETTHGIIRLQTEAPFVFISGITDRLNQFATDVNGVDTKGNVKTEAQNYTVAFNIGIYLSYLIPLLPGFVNTRV